MAKIKTNVRLVRAEEAIWMFVAKSYPEFLDREWNNVLIGTEGFALSAVFGFDADLDPVTHSLSADWRSLAKDLGMKKCEYVIDPDGIKRVLMYDEENKKNDKELA